MTNIITHARWDIAGDSPNSMVGFEDWNPAWVKAILEHLEVDTEEEVAGIIATEQDEEITSGDYIIGDKDVDYKEREVIPYNGYTIGMMVFGHVWITVYNPDGSYRLVKSPCVAVYNASPTCLYVIADHTRGLPQPTWCSEITDTPAFKDTKQTDIVGMLFGVPQMQSASTPKDEEHPAIRKLPYNPILASTMDLMKATAHLIQAIHHPETSRLAGQDTVQLLRDTYSEEVCVAMTELESAIFPSERPYATIRKIASEALAAHPPEKSTMPVGNIKPDDLYTELFPGEEDWEPQSYKDHRG